MLHQLRLLFFLLLSSLLFSQTKPGKGTVDSHSFFVKQLASAKDQNYTKILADYDAFIVRNPGNITAQIERCKFLGNAYWDAYEDYNLKYEETEECIAALYEKYPLHPGVLIYRAEQLYGEERMAALLKAEETIKEDKSAWSSAQLAIVYEMLGDAQGENDDFALAYFLKAEGERDRLDLSLSIANIYQRQGKPTLAKEVLMRGLAKDTAKWVLNQKANLLLKLDEPAKALELFNDITEKDSTFIDKSEMATVMEDLSNYKLAREFLVKDTVQEWNKVGKLQKLFNHDLEHSKPEVALQSYRTLQKLDSNDDFFGIKRLKIAFEAPLLSWNASELIHFFFFLLSIVLLFFIPYLWVLPLHSLGALLRKTALKITPKLNFNWSTKHFWLISFLYLFAQYITVVVFDYETTINYYFDIGDSFMTEEEEDSQKLATTMLFYVAIMSVVTLAVLKRNVLKHLYHSNLSLLRMFSLGIGFVIFNGVLLRFLGGFIDLSEGDAIGVLLSAKREIIAILSGYGFAIAVIAMAVVVPIYEEVIFRGVILGSVEKQVGFVAANIFQATLFALIHYDLKLFVFYFSFGIITGYFANRSQGLLTGIILHAVNNFLVVSVLYYTMRSVF